MENVMQFDSRNIPALFISALSLLISLTTAIHSFWTKSQDASKSARANFEESIEALIDLRKNREELREKLGENWGKTSSAALRSSLNDKRELLLPKAKFLIEKYKVDVSSVANIIIGANLSDAGRHSESCVYYKRAVEVSDTDVSIAQARRVYGRALILSGEVEEGRAEMLAAADTFQALQAAGGLDSDVMRGDQADVFIRLIWAQVQYGDVRYISEDHQRILVVLDHIRDQSRRRIIDAALFEMRDVLRSAHKQQ